jgi:hypothetical protein
MAAELHVEHGMGTGHLPGIALLQPFVSYFDLPAVTDVLIENAELIPEPVTDRGNL